LEPFDESTAAQFFGRRATTEDLARRVEKSPLTVLFGDSGSGKSSIVRAGLVPELRSRDWRVVVVRGVGEKPFESLAAELLEISPEATRTAFSDRLNELTAALIKNGVVPDTRHAVGANRNEKVLLVVDQVEELFTARHLDESVPEKFLQQLAGPARLEGGKGFRDQHFAVLLCLRSEYLDRLSESIKDVDLVERSVELHPLAVDDLRQAIVEPAVRAGASFDSGLVERILEHIEGQPGCLPGLQFLLTRLWDDQDRGRLLLDTYERLGGVEGALVRKADELFDDFSDDEKEAMRRILVQMVQVGRTDKGLRRPLSDSDLLPGDWQVVQQMADERLVSTSRRPDGEATASIAHEALVTAWPRLKSWVDKVSSELDTLDDEADLVIKKYARRAAASGSLLPWAAVPVWVRMATAIAEIYGIDLASDTARTMTLRAAKSFGGFYAGLIGVNGLLNFATKATPYLLPAVGAQVLIISSGTRSVGRAWKEYCRLRYIGAADPDFVELAKACRAGARAKLKKVISR
jgi:hypothetical protein